MPKNLEVPSKMMTLKLKDRTTLYNSYMGCFKNGGVFVPTDEAIEMGEEVLLVLEVMENVDKFPLKTLVAWKTPSARPNHPKGVGLAFPDSDVAKRAKAIIENNLAGLLDHPRPTYTI